MICTPCGFEIPDGHAAIFGLKLEDGWAFGWTCCHKPVGDVDLVLGSLDCFRLWLAEHPECAFQLFQLLLEHKERHGSEYGERKENGSS